MWASICTQTNVTTSKSTYYQHIGNKVLVSWRMTADDTWETAFDLYRTIGDGTEEKLNTEPIAKSTCWQDTSPVVGGLPADITYRLTYADSDKTLATYTITADQVKNGRPYISIPLRDTRDVCDADTVVYQANDVSVGDLDGDGEYEIVVKRLIYMTDSKKNVIEVEDERQLTVPHQTVWDAYKLNGTFLWRIKGGPNTMTGNQASFAIADFDGDGRAEMAIRTTEGTIFGDGTEIEDQDGDGIIDYRPWAGGGHYCSRGPEYISIIDGLTGRELARADYPARGTDSSAWGDDYWKRANSHRVGVGCFDDTGLPSVVIGRGVYARSVIEAWDYRNGQLTRRFHFDTKVAGGRDKNKDGKPNSAYAAQGNHSFSVADLDGDGYDEIMYGSMALDHDGRGLWTSGLGHGDAQHVGKFLPDRDGLQVFHCLETGKTLVALHDAADGSIIWDKVDATEGDMGRCLVADIDPDSPGCEFWYYGSNAFAADGTDLGYKPGLAANMAIWFDGSLNRQGINEAIISSYKLGRTFTMYRYDIAFINGTKSNPAWYGDILGDWREEVIVPDATLLKDLKVFTTWYPTEHKFPWLMLDHTYQMSALNENIGYNQPTHTGFYLGSDLKHDSDIYPTAIESINIDRHPANAPTGTYTLTGQKLTTMPSLPGIYIQDGKKWVKK